MTTTAPDLHLPLLAVEGRAFLEIGRRNRSV
jgi:hypothetical protein